MLKKGDTLDNYEIRALLGAGAFGRVWRAKDLTVKGRQVAIKELTDPTPERLEGFLREMEILASLHHPGIVTFHHALNQGQYLVMEYIPEGSLRSRLQVDTAMPPRTQVENALTVMISLCDVLTAVHECRVVHRDLKPDNIFLQGQTVRVGDFGIAEILRTGNEILRSGTLPYMAPEIFNKEFGRPDHRVDLYAVGIILAELLTGSRPFQASDAGQLIYRICFEAPPVSRDVPPWLRLVIQKLLAKAPDLRFQSADELKRAMESRNVPQLYPSALIKANRSNLAAGRQFARGKVMAALSQTEQGLQHYPEHPRLLFTQAQCLLVLRKAGDALSLLLRARQLDPGIQCEKELGYAHIQNGQYGKAISCLTEYTRRNPDDLTAFNLLMEALYFSDAYDQVMEIGKVFCGESPVFLNNGILATAFSSDPAHALGLFTELTRPMKHVPGFIRHNMQVLGNLKGGSPARVKAALFFAPFANTVRPSRSTKSRRTSLRVEVQRGGEHVSTMESDEGFASVGRDDGLDIVLASDKRISRFHGVFFFRDALYHYRDLGSTGGSYMDNDPLEGDIPLMGMETVNIGRFALTVSY